MLSSAVDSEPVSIHSLKSNADVYSDYIPEDYGSSDIESEVCSEMEDLHLKNIWKQVIEDLICKLLYTIKLYED